MPHPKNHLKLTGDTHLPDVGDYLDELDDEPMDFAPGALVQMREGNRSTRTMQPRSMQLQTGGMTQRYFDSARDQVRARPYAALGGAFALGFVLARLFR